ncbi:MULTISPECIES: DMT family transporter [unclassified Fusibacter]|uniref:DMT family transporter n=1 Tax=unclassified Fusibacter TaxID=2624464 RepID=UPI0010126511|nr:MULTISPECIES: DMT family transporter [unclassified Fusibacter]MCK8060136.1 DMT family transporter [Fusibacter sp. A2]NPE22278.1 DMT family transporter [Fusibacter sp. A1]
MDHKKRAIVTMLVSAFAFSLMGVFVKMTGDIPVIQKSVFRTVTIMVISYYMMKQQKVNLSEIRHIKLLGIRSVTGTVGIILNYYAIDHLILSDANVIFRLSTIFVMFFSWIFLKERMNHTQGLAAIIAFSGVVLIIKPQFAIEVIPYALALLGAASAAGAYTALRALGGKEKPVLIVFFFSLFTTVVLLPYVAFTFVPMTLSQWIYAVAAGVCAAVGQFGVTFAYKYAPAREVSIYNYYGVIFSAMFGMIFFGTFPDGWSLVGYVIVFASSYLMYYSNKIKN